MSLGLREADLPPAAIRRAVARFRHLEGADVVWLGVRESRSRAVVIRWATGVRSLRGLGLRIQPGVGAGGAVLASGRPRCAAGSTDGGGLSGSERSLLTREATTAVMIVPLKGEPLGQSRDPRLEGLAYVGRRDGGSFREETVAEAMRLGERVALPVRNAQRLQEASRRLAQVEAAATQEKAPENRLYETAHVMAAEARVLLRSGIGIVFRLDRTSGALHSLGVEGADLPELRRGQVLPPGCGSAGRAVATRAPFVARDYGSGAVQVPPIMSNALPAWVSFTTLSVPLFEVHEVIGALTVARASDLPYSPDDVRLAERMAAEAGPFLARAQHAAETARRQQGASELSRFADSLTHTLSVSAVSERLVHGVISLVRGTEAAVEFNETPLTQFALDVSQA